MHYRCVYCIGLFIDERLKLVIGRHFLHILDIFSAEYS